MKVGEYYNYVYKLHGSKIADRFLHLMEEYDGESIMIHSKFYSKELLFEKLKEALE